MKKALLLFLFTFLLFSCSKKEESIVKDSKNINIEEIKSICNSIETWDKKKKVINLLWEADSLSETDSPTWKLNILVYKYEWWSKICNITLLNGKVLLKSWIKL